MSWIKIEDSGESVYRSAQNGAYWSEIAATYHGATPLSAMRAASIFAKEHHLPWPIDARERFNKRRALSPSMFSNKQVRMRRAANAR